MGYHIDTGLIKEKFNSDCDCPLCEIQKVVEEQFLHEFLNDAVMEDNTRILVGKLGFCQKHYDMLINRQNKLSVALQIRTRLDKISSLYSELKNTRQADKVIKELEKGTNSCAICEYVNESMVKYFKTIAQMFVKEKSFLKTLLSSKGFCSHHYAQLLKYSSYAGIIKNDYVNILSIVESRAIEKLKVDLKAFCDKHDYRNAFVPLGDAEHALDNARTRLYGKKFD